MNRTKLICLTLLCVLLSSSAQIALKRGVSSGPVQALLKSEGAAPSFILHAAFAPLVILGLALYATSTLLWLLVLAKADVSYAYPFVSLGFVVITLYAHFAMTEPLSAMKMGGIALITVGVICVARS
jgi:multidrug transporter EmrE-like cation transporter